MFEPMRRHLTELHFRGPVDKENDAVSALRDLGFESIGVTHGKTGDSVPWREVLLDVAGHEVGLSLAGARHKEGLIQRHLSERTGIPQRHIAALETGKRPIGEQNALILANALNVDYRIFL